MEWLVMLILLALVGGLILWPLVRRAVAAPPPAPAGREASPLRMALGEIKELEFDYATGKLAEDDYRLLRGRVEAGLAAATAGETPPRRAQARAADLDATLEAEIRAARGHRFCVACSAALPSGARFCPACGAPAGGHA